MDDTRTADNFIILNGVIQRQLNLGKSLSALRIFQRPLICSTGLYSFTSFET